MLVAGVVLGVLLGPAVLGRIAPDLYDQMFLGSGDLSQLQTAQQQLDRFLNDEDTRMERINRIMQQAEFLGENDSARDSADQQAIALMNDFANEQLRLQNQIEAKRVPILANQQAHQDKLAGMATMMLLLIVVLLAAEAILSPQRDELEAGKTKLPPALARLITIRYALAAGWLMLMLAQPLWLKSIDLIFGGLLLAVVLIAGLIPLSKSQNTTPDPF